MLKPVYCGEYKSSTTTTTGCVYSFMSMGSYDIMFPPMVSYGCELCKKVHNFGLVRTWAVATQRQQQSFAEYCQAHDIETDVDIS